MEMLTDTENDFYLEIERSVLSGHDLEYTKTLLADKFGKEQLSDYDCFRLEESYVKILKDEWLSKTEAVVNIIDPGHFIEFVKELHLVNGIVDCYNLLNRICLYSTSNALLPDIFHSYSFLLTDLLEKSSKIKFDEACIIDQFKSKTQTLLKSKTNYLKNEQNFIGLLQELLKSAESPYDLCKDLGLFPNNDNIDVPHFKEFLSSIVKNELSGEYDLSKLKKAAKEIKDQDNFVYLRDLTAIVTCYLKPPTIILRTDDNRELVEVSGGHIVISQVIKDVETLLKKNDGIEEVRFVNADVIHIDSDLHKKVWHGKNIVVFAHTAIVKCENVITWDVSGQDAEPINKDSAGTGESGCGLHGADGQHGESGGSVLILVEVLRNGKAFIVQSNGGNGSNGQDGGNGEDGKDGYYLQEKTFKQVLPPVSKYINNDKTSNLLTTKDYVVKHFDCLDELYVGNTYLNSNFTKEQFETFLNTQIMESGNFYFRMKMNNGCKITFSFYNGGGFFSISRCQSFVLHEGALGEEGKVGGDGGKRGNGGHAGDIIVKVAHSSESDITIVRQDGCDGSPGKHGTNGTTGKSGLDRAYTDCSVSLSPLTSSWPKWFIPNEEENQKLKVTYQEGSSGAVYCYHNNMYATITKRLKEFKNSYTSETNRSIQQMAFLHEAHVQRKKTINEKNIREKYPLKIYSVHFFKAETILNQIKTVLKESRDEALESKHLTTDSKIIKLNHYFEANSDLKPEDNDFRYNFIENPAIFESLRVPELELLDLVKNDPSDMQNGAKVLDSRLDVSYLQKLYDIAFTNQLKQPLSKEDNKMLKFYFCNKYQLATLEELATAMSNVQYSKTLNNDLGCSLDNMPQNRFEQFFSVHNDKKSHSVDVENNFICYDEQHKHSVMEFLKHILEHPLDYSEILNELMRNFESEYPFPAPLLSNAVKDTGGFEGNLLSTFYAFRNALYREKDRSIFNDLYKGTVENNSNSMVFFENKISSDIFLSTLYHSYVVKAQKKLDWKYTLESNNCDKNEVLKYLLRDIKKNGPLSAYYRVVFAHRSEINIVIYSRNKMNKIQLLHNHNPKAKTSYHFLLEENKFVRLDLKSGFLEMYKSQTNQGRLFNDILIHIDSFIEKAQFDCFKNQCLLTSQLVDYVKTNQNMRIRYTLINILMEERNINNILNSLNLRNAKDVQILHSRLEKLKYEFTKCEAILHYLALHFENEGRHISAEELIYVLNFVLKSAMIVPHVIPLITWIIAAYPQNQWLVEIILMKLELNFQKLLATDIRSTWKKYLCKDNERNLLMLLLERICRDDFIVSEKQFGETIFLLSNVSNAHVGLHGLEFTEWKYYLKNKFWSHKLREVAGWLSTDDLSTASYNVVVLENMFGAELCQKLVDVLGNCLSSSIEGDSEIVVDVLKVMTGKEICVDNGLLDILKRTNISEWKREIENRCFSKEKDRSLDEIIKLIERNGNTCDRIKDNLNEIRNHVKKTDFMLKTIKKHIKEESKLKEWIALFLTTGNSSGTNKSDEMKVSERKSTTSNVTDHNFIDLERTLTNTYDNDGSLNVSSHLDSVFAVVTTAVELKYGFTLRDAQKLSIMTMLKSEEHNTLSQISTGEGKSIIVVIFAIVKVLVEKKKVDIITSSHVLAERDAKAYKEVYNLFGIHVGHNCSEEIEERKKAYSNNKVVYGELANFQRDYLLDKVYNVNIIGNSSFDTIIIDEVDSMLLDKGNNTLYLSHEIPGLDKLEPIFMFIWKSLHVPFYTTEPELVVSELRNKILYDLFGTITKNTLKYLDTTIDEQTVNRTWNVLVNEGFIDNAGTVLKKNIENPIFGTDHGSHLNYLFKKIIERKTSLCIPKYLKQYVEHHLDKWIKNGIKAMTMEPGVDYVVDVDRSGIACDLSPNIIIVDSDTGNDLTSCQWENGLHQFLQLKHGCRLSLINLKAVFISNVSYLKLYKHLYGLTGTIGSAVERELLQETYQVDFITMPTSKTKSFTEDLPILCSNMEEWLNTICEKAFTQVKQKNRSVLIVCETVSFVNCLKRKFHQTYKQEKHLLEKMETYTRDYEKLTIAENLKPGHIIISTNLSGRGTDITLSDELVKTGGLHVCLTFLPRNSRIEEQAFGRAARNGQPGSGQIIFQNSTYKTLMTIAHLKEQRDINEIFRIADIKDYHKSHIQKEEKCFKTFLDIFTKIGKSCHSKNLKLKALLQKVCLDQWAFWLESNSNSLSIESVKDLEKTLGRLGEENFEEWSKVVKDPFQLIKLGLVLVEGEEYDHGISLFDRVIEEEPLFCEGARYYKIYAKSKKNKPLKKKEIMKEMSTVANHLTERINITSMATDIIDSIKKKNPGGILQINSFKDQQTNVIKGYGLFIQSIYNMIGNEITYRDFILAPLVTEETAYFLFQDLVNEKVIIKGTMKDSFSKEDFFFAVNYGLSPEELMSVMNGFEGETYDEEKLLKTLSETFPLPSRERFWSELVSKNVLTNEKRFYIVDLKRLGNIDPSLACILKKIKYSDMELENEVWMYQPNEIDVSENDYIVVPEEDLIQHMQHFKYTFLIDHCIIYPNSLGTLVEFDDITFNEFDSLRMEDFFKIGVSSNIASEIICELQDRCMIKNTKSNEFILLTDLDNFELCRFKAYSSDVEHLLKNYCFSFRIALNNLLKTMKMKDKPVLSLAIRLHENMIKDLHDNKCFYKYIVNPNENISKKIDFLYSKEVNKKQLGSFLKFLYNDKTSGAVVDNLLPTIRADLRSYSIESLLPSHLEKYADTVMKVLQRRSSLEEDGAKKFIKQVALSHMNMLGKIDISSFSLISLTEKLREENLQSSTDYDIFTLNGFDNILQIEEKKYTLEMLFSTLFVAVSGVSKICVDVIMKLMNGYASVGAELVFRGIYDIIYSLNSLRTGHFTGRINYSMNIAVSFLKRACFFFKPIDRYISVFGSILSSASSSSTMSAVKTKCSTFFEKTKKIFTSIFKKMSSAGVESTVTSSAIVKRVITQLVTGVDSGLTLAGINNYLQIQFENMRDILVEHLLEDIHEIDAHTTVTTYIKEIYSSSREIDAKRIISLCFSQVLEDQKCEITCEWGMLVDKLMTLVAQEFPSCLRNNGSSLANSVAYGSNVATLINKLNKIIESKKYFERGTIIPNIMNRLEKKLQTNVIKIRETSGRPASNISCEERFISKTVDDLKKKIKTVISENVSVCVISPVMNYLKNTSLDYFLKKGLETNRLHNEDINLSEENEEICKKFEFQLAKKSEISNCFYYKEYDEFLMEIFKAKRSVCIYLEILKNSCSADSFFLELCCLVIPLALKHHGFTKVPMFKVVVTSNGMQHTYGGDIGEESDVLTIDISPDDNLFTDFSQKRFLLRSTLDKMYNKLLQNYPDYKELTTELLNNLVIKAIENDFYIQNFVSQSTLETDIEDVNNSNIGTEDCKLGGKKKSIEENGSVLDESTAVCIKLKDVKMSKYQIMKAEAVDGFESALKRINQHLLATQAHLKNFNLSIEDFTETSRAIIPNDGSDRYFDSYATGYTLVIPFNDLSSGLLIDYNVTMSLNGHCATAQRCDPVTPRINYAMHPIIITHCKQVKSCLKGHIELKHEYKEDVYGIKDCSSVGELILPNVTNIKQLKKEKKIRKKKKNNDLLFLWPTAVSIKTVKTCEVTLLKLRNRK